MEKENLDIDVGNLPPPLPEDAPPPLPDDLPSYDHVARKF